MTETFKYNAQFYKWDSSMDRGYHQYTEGTVDLDNTDGLDGIGYLETVGRAAELQVRDIFGDDGHITLELRSVKDDSVILCKYDNAHKGTDRLLNITRWGYAFINDFNKGRTNIVADDIVQFNLNGVDIRFKTSEDGQALLSRIQADQIVDFTFSSNCKEFWLKHKNTDGTIGSCNEDGWDLSVRFNKEENNVS